MLIPDSVGGADEDSELGVVDMEILLPILSSAVLRPRLQIFLNRRRAICRLEFLYRAGLLAEGIC